jgi:hypothetical protein
LFLFISLLVIVKCVFTASWKGERGDIGPAGPRGERGMKGEQGYVGVKGSKGEKGVGIKGHQGERVSDSLYLTFCIFVFGLRYLKV